MRNVWLKRFIIGFAIFTLLSFTAFIAFLTGVTSGFLAKAETVSLGEEVILGEDQEDKIGILRLEGIILSSGFQGPFSSSGIVTSSQVKRWFREVVKDDNLKALVIEVNSPGGSPVAADEIYQAIQTLRKSGRSVVVVMEDTATSGAYFFSAAADKIIANPATLTGSIGVITEITNIEDLLQKVGVDIEVYKSGQYKDFTSPARERTEEEKAMIQEFIDDAYDLFISRVVEGRKMDKVRVEELAQGQVYSGVKALELGLIDSLGSVEDAVDEAKNLQNLDQVKIVRFRTESPLDILLGRVGTYLNPFSSMLAKLTNPGLRAAYLPSF